VNAPSESVRLYSSWRGLVLAFVSPVLLLGFGSAMFLGGTRWLVPAVFVAGGVALGLVTLFDYPIHTTIDGVGVTRRTPLRSHVLAWPAIERFSRARGGRLGRRPGPLAAVSRRRRYLLVDRAEGPDEYDALQRCLKAHDVVVGLPVEPAPGTVPTWLYHRRRVGAGT